MQKPESVLEKKVHKILSDFEVQMDHRIPTKMPDLALINTMKRTYHLLNTADPADPSQKARPSSVD